jgi:hypothetical protein
LVVLANAVLAIVLGLFLVTRRFSGAITTPLPPLPLAATALGLLVWAAVHRGVCLFRFEEDLPHRDRCLRVEATARSHWLPTAVLLLFAIACSYPANRWIDWLVWLPALAVDWWWARMMTAATRTPTLSSPSTREAPLEPVQPLQQLSRYRTADGAEAIRGELIAEFAAGERNVTLYVAFCPPFERLPVVEAEIGDGSPAIVKVAQVLHHGAQLDVRLPTPTQSRQTIAVHLFASDAGNTA